MRSSIVILAAICAMSGLAGPANASNDPVRANPNTGANFNRYAYANNNPYTFTDPNGRVGKLFWTSSNQVTYTLPYVIVGSATPQFTPAQINAQIARNFSGTVNVNGTAVTVTAQAVQVTSPKPGEPVNTITVVPTTEGVTRTGRSETNAIGGNQITVGATGSQAATPVTVSHELGGHAGGAGDQYAGGVDVNGHTLQADVPGPNNIMHDLSGAGANQQTLGEVIGAKTNINQCAEGVSAASGAC